MKGIVIKPILALVLLLLTMPFVLSSASDLNENVWAYWSFDSGYDEETGNVSYTNAVGSPTAISTNCGIGSCYNYSVGNYFDFDQSTFSTGDVTLTIAGYIYPTSLGNYRGIVSLGHDNTGTEMIYVDLRDSPTNLSMGKHGNDAQPYSQWSAVVNNGTWFTITKKAEVVKYYIDGQYKGTGSFTAGARSLDLTGDAHIGELWTGVNLAFIGGIDEIYIIKDDEWNATQVNEWYNRTKLNGEQYPFTDGTPATPTLTVKTDMKDTSNYNENTLTINYNGTISNFDYDIFECVLFNGTDILQSKQSANLSINNQFVIDTSNIESYYNLSITCSYDLDYNATSYNITIGTYQQGNLSSLQKDDNYTLSWFEKAGVNGGDAYFNYTGVTGFSRVHIKSNYSNGQTNAYFLKAYNYTAGDWDTLFTLDLYNVYNDIEVNISYDDDYISGEVTQLRLHHSGAGNPLHLLNVDLLVLENPQLTDSTETYDYKVDTITPIITGTIVNNSQFFTDDELEFSFTFEDNNLLATNVSWYRGNTLLQNFFSDNLTTTSYTNTSSYTPTIGGNYSIQTQVWDSHTTTKLKDVADLLSDGVLYRGIRVKSNDAISFKIKENIDKYNFDVEFKTKDEYYTFIVSGSSSLRYLPNSKYDGHFVDINNGVWVDFISNDISEYSVIKDGVGKYNVTVYVTAKKVTFESIGDLNYNEKIWYFEVVDQQTQLLSNIDSNLSELVKTIAEGLIMIGIIIFIVVFIILSIITKNKFLFVLSGAFMMLASYVVGNSYISDGLPYQKAYMLLLFFLGLIFILVGVLVTLKDKLSNKSDDEDFYLNY